MNDISWLSKIRLSWRLDNMVRWPMMLKLGFMCGCMVIAQVVMYPLFIFGKQIQLNRLELLNLETTQALTINEQKNETLSYVTQEIKEARQQLEIAKRGIGNVQVAIFLASLSQSASDNYIQILQMDVKTEVEHEQWIETAIHLKISGSYYQFRTFVEAVNQLPFIFILNEVTIERRESDYINSSETELLATMVASYYQSNMRLQKNVSNERYE